MSYVNGSSPQAGPTSPGTDPTVYSPVIVRDGRQRPDIQPLVTEVFLNEIDPVNNEGFISRYLRIDAYPGGASFSENPLIELEIAMKDCKAHPILFSKAIPLRVERKTGNHQNGASVIDLYLKFDDIKHAMWAKAYLISKSFDVSFTTQRGYADVKSLDLANIDPMEGQIKLFATSPQVNSPAEIKKIAGRVCELMGSIRRLVLLTEDSPFLFRIEYDSVDAANRTVQMFASCPDWALGGDKENGLEVSFVCTHWLPPLANAANAITLHAPAHSRQHPNDIHNRVRREKVVDGSDIRTTVMLRNIPNKLDWLELKAILDRHCFGTYDFLYLRIDFTTGCNVGYAFINFVDTGGMIAMIDRIEGRNWAAFRSAKAAEISYATIQGREALVSKFRNSSVMQETAYCRPRLFYSSDDAMPMPSTMLIGTEQEFPHPDNLAKLNRSIDSARSTGLYPPNASGLVDHRNRSGMYDNGNPRDRFNLTTQVDPALQARIEDGWACRNNFAMRVPFAHIPREFVEQYLAFINSTQRYSGVGVIGHRPPPNRPVTATGTQFDTTFSGLRLA